ncbi:hypothetical protein BZA05DRAFT_270541 [Tricharina praecox]|uniref:uncharacterized protein n=1 Tax=Tricharina praecox TaxID=43433 RepID=UPI00221ED8EB|nr:uncharacterized protein BZA05DRAFT_270541 [Tricharina praecox]KAI5853818.1 hypothetical protein BZA05DRAFT_270541 [Tricharina praecox]
MPWSHWYVQMWRPPSTLPFRCFFLPPFHTCSFFILLFLSGLMTYTFLNLLLFALFVACNTSRSLQVCYLFTRCVAANWTRKKGHFLFNFCIFFSSHLFSFGGSSFLPRSLFFFHFFFSLFFPFLEPKKYLGSQPYLLYKNSAFCFFALNLPCLQSIWDVMGCVDVVGGADWVGMGWDGDGMEWNGVGIGGWMGWMGSFVFLLCCRFTYCKVKSSQQLKVKSS